MLQDLENVGSVDVEVDVGVGTVVLNQSGADPHLRLGAHLSRTLEYLTSCKTTNLNKK